MSMMQMEDVVYDMDQYENESEEYLYDTIQMKQSRKVLIEKFKPNPAMWSKKFADTVVIAQDKYRRSGLAATFHGLRLLIQRQTLYAIENGYYEANDGTKVVIDQNDVIKSAKGTKFYTSKDITNITKNGNKITNYFKKAKKNDDSKDNNNDEKKEKDSSECDIDVFNTDCLDAAYQLLCDGYNPCLLNMANQYSPGGGFQSGQGAQEENLCRRTTLITALVNYVKTKEEPLDAARTWGYPIEQFGTIYVPDVIVIRSNEHKGYEFLSKPYKMAIVTAAMFNRPKYDNNYDYTNESKPEVAKKLASVLRTAYDNGHDSIVLSAWGCGAFRNPPLGQSKLWKEMLFNNKEFKGKFKKIIFAIFDDHNAGKQHNPFGNYIPFIQTFDITEKRINEFVQEMNSFKEKDDNNNDDVEMKNNNNNNNDDVNVKVDALKVLCSVLQKATNYDLSESRDLDYEVIDKRLGGNNMVAMNILYCAGFKRSSDGSRLQLEKQRIGIADNVYQQLLKFKTN